MPLSIGQLSKQCGIKIPTIRYYEQQQLIETPSRTEGNQRRYNEQALEQLQFIKHARQLGLSIEAIRELLALNAHPQQNCAEADRIAKTQLAAVQQRITQLQQLEAELSRIASGCEASTGMVDGCYVLKSLGDHSLCSNQHTSRDGRIE